MDELENAAPGEEPVHRPLDRLLAVLVPVDGDHRGAVPGLAVPAAVRRRRGGEGRQVHAPRTSPAKRSSESEKERKRQKKKKDSFASPPLPLLPSSSLSSGFLIKPTKNCRRFRCFFFFIFFGAKFRCCSVVNGRWLTYVFVALVSPLVIDCRCCSLIYFCMSLCAS